MSIFPCIENTGLEIVGKYVDRIRNQVQEVKALFLQVLPEDGVLFLSRLNPCILSKNWLEYLSIMSDSLMTILKHRIPAGTLKPKTDGFGSSTDEA